MNRYTVILSGFRKTLCFSLTKVEYDSLRSQFAILKKGQHSKYLPYVFTENGVAMLSSVLKSKQAIEVNIQIMRTFTRLREMIASNVELSKKLDDLERKLSGHDLTITVLCHATSEQAIPVAQENIIIGL